MKKKNILGALLLSTCMAVSGLTPVSADAVKVVTMGADLTQEQKNTMMRYFKVDSNQVQTLTITNQDERDRLSAYVPLEQIGTRTVSCAYVKPTQSGGIKVRTANLNWVTCNMIATTLSTSGVSNCEVVAACPFEVSGTGALTGIMMAYETASGEKLDETKKEIATEELVVTGKLAEQVGQNDATNIINQAKQQIIQNNVQDADEIYNIVVNIAEQNNTQLGSEQLDKIVSLLEEIAQQNYDYEQMKETLENVSQNVSGELGNSDEVEEVPEDEDSIIADLDESILGEDVIAGSTEDPTLEEETRPEEEMNSSEDDVTMDPDMDIEGEELPEMEEGTGEEEIPEAEGEGTDGAEELNTDALGEEAKAQFDKAKAFAAGEYEGDSASLQSVMGEDAAATVTLDAETGAKVSNRVLKDYLKILTEGTEAYVPGENDMYLSTELNMIDSAMKKVFRQEETEEEDLLVNLSEEEKQTLYQETMKFFEVLYGESSVSYEEENYDAAELGENTEVEEYTEEIPAE